ncbi:MAG: hypothetical protein ACJA1W_000253 [Akkermansiaceae bacterium]|jgi:hypothetical protein
MIFLIGFHLAMRGGGACQILFVSWTDIFSVMDVDMVGTYQSEASSREKEALAQLFEVEAVHNVRKTGHAVATGLFWKPASPGEAEYPQPTEEIMRNPAEHGLPSRFKNPWVHYVEPVFEAARHLGEIRPDLVYRVYLGNDLSFLIPKLLEAGCEVYLMKSSSIRHNPGAMWRFLAMEEDCLVTMSDSDRAREMIHDIERTELVAEGGLNFWRSPYFFTKRDAVVGSPGGYHTSSAGLMGCAKPLPMRELCEAFVWCCEKGLMRDHCLLGERKVPIAEAKWPTFGFDEWFINAVIHPRVAFEGGVTFVNWKATYLNHWFALDIEYCTWANPKSEIMFWGTPEEKEDGEEDNELE